MVSKLSFSRNVPYAKKIKTMFVHLKLEFDNYYLFFTEGENFEEFGHLAYLAMTST